MQGREREIDTISPKIPAPQSTEQLGQQKFIGPALETHQSHTIKYGVNQIIPEILRGE